MKSARRSLKKSMRTATIAALLGSVALLLPAGLRAASAPPFRASSFLHVCAGGENRRDVCRPILDPAADPDFCPGGSCEMVLDGKRVNAKLTIIADDDVTTLDGRSFTSTRVGAATAILQIKKDVFANTYQTLEGTTLGELLAALALGATGIGLEPVDETFLATRLGVQTSAEFDLLYLGSQDFFGFGPALKERFLIEDERIPVITRVKRVSFTDFRSSGGASAVQMKLSIGFLLPNAAPPAP